MLELKNICKSFGSLRVLSDVSLSVADAEIAAIVGPSGAGKTTLLQIAGTLSAADSGAVLYDGVDVARMRDRRLSEFRNRSIGFIFQFHQLLPEFTAEENVMLPALVGGESRAEARRRAQKLLDMLDVLPRAAHKPAQLSGGEKQRVAIARALVRQPRIVLADEPTGSLDSHNRNEIRALISRLRAELGQAFMIVTHDPTVATVADRVIAMADGRIVGTAEADAPDSHQHL